MKQNIKNAIRGGLIGILLSMPIVLYSLWIKPDMIINLFVIFITFTIVMLLCFLAGKFMFYISNKLHKPSNNQNKKEACIVNKYYIK